MVTSLFRDGQFDDDDDDLEADKIYSAIDERMSSKRKRRNDDAHTDTARQQRQSETSAIGDQASRRPRGRRCRQGN